MANIRFLTTEAIFLRGVDVMVSSLLSELFDTEENTPEDFFLRRPLGFFLSPSAETYTECRIGATPPSLSELESSLKKAGSRLTLCVRLRRPGVLPVSGDVSKASARWRSGIRTDAVLLGNAIGGFGRGHSQSDWVMRSGEEDASENGDRSRTGDSCRSGILSWM